MKIYQIHEMGGEWEDSYDYIVGTYLHREVAISNMERLLEENKRMIKCNNCPIHNSDYELTDLNQDDIDEINDYCDEYFSDSAGWCHNYNYCDELSSFKIEEVEVDETLI